MNTADKKRLLYLCSVCVKDSIIIFDENEAYTNTQSQTVSIKLSNNFANKVAFSPTTLQSIITTMPDGDIEINSLKDFKFKFKSKNMQRLVTAIDADYAIRFFMEKESDSLTVMNPEEFAKSIAFVSSFAHKDGLIPFSSVYVRISGNIADFFATDGTSMAYRRYVQRMPFEDDINLVIPQAHLQSVIRVLADDGAKIAQINIDKNRRVEFSTENFSTIMAPSAYEFKNLLPIMDNEAALSSNREMKADAHKIDLDNAELKQSLSNIISMFVKNEFPYVDVHIYKNKMNLETETLARGYDCFKASIEAMATGEYAIRVSPTMFLKALSKVKNATIYWRNNMDIKVNPFVLDNGTEMVFFAPTATPPKEDENYD